MNERIKELMKEANKDITLGKPFWSALEEFSEKFAELIVEECVAQCWTVSAIEHKGYVISECSKRIRKHFGVEE
jgi:type II secretory pathway component PulF